MLQMACESLQLSTMKRVKHDANHSWYVLASCAVSGSVNHNVTTAKLRCYNKRLNPGKSERKYCRPDVRERREAVIGVLTLIKGAMQDDNIYRPPRGRGGRGGHQRQGDVPPDPPSRLSRNGPGEDGGGRDGGGRGRGRPRGRGGGRGGRGGGRRGGRNDVKDSGRASWKDRREQRKEG
eukprot:g59664.t1